jgi:hypothetical protein
MADILMTADEARRKTREYNEESLKYKLDIINKVIDQACHRGDSCVVIGVISSIDKKVADILRKYGYSIEYNQMDDKFKISWYEEDSE